MTVILNRPQTLAYEPLDSEHVLACARVPYEAVASLIDSAGKGKWLTTLKAKAPKPCCQEAQNLDIEAWFSTAGEQAKGAADLYKVYCRVCEAGFEAGTAPGYCHVFFCIGGGDERPMWEVR